MLEETVNNIIIVRYAVFHQVLISLKLGINNQQLRLCAR